MSEPMGREPLRIQWLESMNERMKIGGDAGANHCETTLLLNEIFSLRGALAEMKAERVEQDARAERFIAHAKGIARGLGEQIAKTAEVASLVGMLHDARGLVVESEGYRAEANAKVAHLERTVERLREALTKYGQHDYTCAIPLRGGDRCDCGLERVHFTLASTDSPPADTHDRPTGSQEGK